MNKASLLKFFKRYKDLIAIFVILFVCYFLYFFSMGAYPLIDVDETRYVAMSRDLFHANDLLTLYLNGDYFFEKPPLYFWLEVLSFSIFGKITEVTARIPVSLCAVFGVGITYFLGSKISSKKYGLICSLILASCFEYVVTARSGLTDVLDVSKAMGTLSVTRLITIHGRSGKHSLPERRVRMMEKETNRLMRTVKVTKLMMREQVIRLPSGRRKKLL